MGASELLSGLMNDDEKAVLLQSAIARKLCSAAVYNRREVLLAPYALFTRHGDMFLRASIIQLDGLTPREVKLGTFKVAGLGEVRLTRKLFRPQAELIASMSAREGEAEVARVVHASAAA
jgi:hypothetical protein